jgi:acid phosphatase type 7
MTAAAVVLLGVEIASADTEPLAPAPPAARSAASVPVVVAVGDIACSPSDPHFNGGRGTQDYCRQQAVGRLAARQHPDALLLLGDEQYERGAYAAFRRSFRPAFGALRSVTHPAPGNHEYGTPNARGYFRYFGHRARPNGHSWYSYSVGSWHVISLNSNCAYIGGCGRSSAEGKWLRADLRRHHAARCTIAYWHHPLHSSGAYATSADTKAAARPLWRAVSSHGVDIVLNGHDHIYERFAPIDGVRQFIVGTGGRSHYTVHKVAAKSRYRLTGHFGVLVLHLRKGSYRWSFVTTAHHVRDHGVGTCH